MSEYTVSHHTEELAIRCGVVLVPLDLIMLPEVVAIAFRGGRIVRSGHPLWVRSELERMGAKIVRDYTEE
jgi:hypothetical protein